MTDDADGFTVRREVERTAAKEHRCGECARTITPGARYTYATGLYDGRWHTYHQCAHCRAVARWLEAICDGWLYNAVLDDLREHVNEAEETTVLPLLVDLIGPHRPGGQCWEGVDVATVEDHVRTSVALYRAAERRHNRRLLEAQAARMVA